MSHYFMYTRCINGTEITELLILKLVVRSFSIFYVGIGEHHT